MRYIGPSIITFLLVLSLGAFAMGDYSWGLFALCLGLALLCGVSVAFVILAAELFSRYRTAFHNSFAFLTIVTSGGMLVAGMWCGLFSLLSTPDWQSDGLCSSLAIRRLMDRNGYVRF
jgi:hypothetical protein